jgi:uncharacterized protein YcfJ
VLKNKPRVFLLKNAIAKLEKKMKIISGLLALSIGLFCGHSVLASGYSSTYIDDDRSENYAWARVVSVEPIFETYTEPTTRDVCYDQPTEYYEPQYTYRRGSRSDGTGGAILGAIIGGALGNQVGKGDGRKAATIAGAVIGGSVGHDRATRGRYRETGGRVVRGSERVCDTQTHYREQRQVVAYDVGYEFRGRIYHTETDTHPGNRIRVRVSVEPAE